MLYRTMRPMILASGSPRRRELLASVGVAFEVRPSVDEPQPEPGELPEAYVLRAARAKCVSIAEMEPGHCVVAADSVVCVGGEILGKPRDAEEALTMLAKLCGGGAPVAHVVCTGCCIMGRMGGERTQECFAVSTTVVMAPQPLDVRRAYVATGEPMDKAGAYAIQGLGSALVREIHGSYTNVVGLPLARVLEVLISWGVVVPRQG